MIGRRISYYRRVKGITQKELAARLGVSPQAVSFWEKETTNPSADKFQAIADALDISIKDLIEEKKNDPVQENEQGQEREKVNSIDRDVEAALRLRRERPEILKLIASDGYTDEQIRAIAEVLRKTK